MNIIVTLLAYLIKFIKDRKVLFTVLGIAFLYYEFLYFKKKSFEPTVYEIFFFFLMYEFSHIKEILKDFIFVCSHSFLYAKAQTEKHLGKITEEEYMNACSDRFKG